MRDIRSDLRERLALIGERYAVEMADYGQKRETLEAEHDAVITTLDRERAAVEQLLAIEEGRQGLPAAIIEARKTARHLPLDVFLTTKCHAHGPMNKDQLRAEANLAGYFEEGNGRTFHITLMNITKCGKLTQLPDGRFAFPKRQPAIFDQSEESEMQTLM